MSSIFINTVMLTMISPNMPCWFYSVNGKASKKNILVSINPWVCDELSCECFDRLTNLATGIGLSQ